MRHVGRLFGGWVAVLSLASLAGLCGCEDDGPTGPAPGPETPGTVNAPEPTRSWGERGSDPAQFGYPGGATLDASGRLYVTDLEMNRILKFDASGGFLGAWGTPGTAPGQLDGPRDVDLDDQGNVYVAEYRNCRIQVFDADGHFIRGWGERGSLDGQFVEPQGIAVHGADVYVIDTVGRVQHFGLEGAFYSSWGRHGSGRGEFLDPFAVDVDANGHVWVADHAGIPVQEFSSTGTLLSTWDQRGGGPGEFQGPIALCVDEEGRILVSDGEDGRTQILDRKGRFLAQWNRSDVCSHNYTPIGLASRDGIIDIIDASNRHVDQFAIPATPSPRTWWTWGMVGSAEGTFSNPHGVAVDADNRVYIADTNNGRVQVFSPKGFLLGGWNVIDESDGSLGAPGFVSVEGERVYVGDWVHNCVRVYDRSGNSLDTWNGPSPNGIDVGPSGEVYVVANRNQIAIDVFDANGVLLRSWGDLGDQPGQLRSARDVAIEASGSVLVADTFTMQVSRFDANGGFLDRWNVVGLGGAARPPLGLGLDAAGKVLVATWEGVLVFDPSGLLLGAVGESGECAKQFLDAGDVAVDANGDLIITDPRNNRVQAFAPSEIAVPSPVHASTVR